MAAPMSYHVIKSRASAVREQFPAFNEAECCTAVAWAALHDVTLDAAVSRLHALTGRLPGSIPWVPYLGAYGKAGATLVQVYPKGLTMKTLTRGLPKTGRYLVEVSRGRHAAAVVDGEVIDWSAGKMNRVSRVWRVDF